MSETGARRPAAWLFSPAVDLLIGCGAWSLPLVAFTLFVQRGHGVAVSFAFYLLAVFCNNPHYMATIYRAYGTAADFNQYRFFTIYVTLLLVLTVVLVHLAPGLFPWVVTLYLTWSPWHYTSQNFGIAQMLLRRAGAPADPVARRWLWAGYLAAYGVWFITLHSEREAGDPYFLSLGIPPAMATPLQLFFAFAFAGSALAAFTRLARHLPLRVLAGPLTLTLTQSLWFVAPALLMRFGGLELPASYLSAGALAFMHCAQYLWITSYYARRETPSFRFPRYYFALIVGGLALFIPGPWIASRLLGHDFVESFMIFTALVNLHHFILDGAIWKLRDSRIARLLLGSGTRAPDAVDTALAAPGISHPLGWLFGAAPAARVARRTLAAAVLALGALDQWQYFSTTRAASDSTLALAATVNPADPRPAFRRAQDLEAAGDLAGARRELERLLALNPRNARAGSLLGRVLFRLNDTPAALALYDRLFEFFPRDMGVALNRGLAAEAERQPAKALASYERAARLAVDHPEAHTVFARALAHSGETSRAIDEYDEYFLEVEARPPPDGLPDYLRNSTAEADLLTAQGSPASLHRAEQRLQRAADIAVTRRLFPEAVVALQRLATVQEQLSRPAEAARTRAVAAQAAQFAH
jgi:tetratricopeptide (TPR) repeat protein